MVPQPLEISSMCLKLSKKHARFRTSVSNYNASKVCALRSVSRWETSPIALRKASSMSWMSSWRVTLTALLKPWVTRLSSSLPRKFKWMSLVKPWVRLAKTMWCWPALPMPLSWVSRFVRRQRHANWPTAKVWKSTLTPSSTMLLTTSRVSWWACLTR